MKITAALLLVLGMSLQGVNGDVYMHSPRGSNNRNCRTDNNKARRNGNRLFDSQNNENGGYSCPRAFPFSCYKQQEDNGNGAAQNCRQQNNGGNKDQMVNKEGQLVNPAATNTPTQFYYSGSELPISWTAQHGMGDNNELHSDVIIQYACEDTLSDNCAATTTDQANGGSPFYPGPGEVCSLRDGTPVRTNDNNNGLNAEATDTITENNGQQDDYRYGRHETLAYYKECQNRERNKGLWIADQQLQGNAATATRQNPNNNRNGLECPEEQNYYPYEAHSPWKDIAIITSDASKCGYYQAESQNVKPRGRCDCYQNGQNQCAGNGNQPNNPNGCAASGWKWVATPAHNIPAPQCVLGAYVRQNHLGNAAGTGQEIGYNWTLPEVTTKQRCVLRIRYNMSSSDFNDTPRNADSKLNGANSPLKDNDENEAETYKEITGFGAGASLGFAMNTDQFARTFEDRSYVFEIHPKPTGITGKIYNLNTKGKRGNIVQTYPATEYDFVPSQLQVEAGDYIHYQVAGSDYNPDRNGNNGEGGPYAANNNNKETKTDRHNLVMSNPGDTIPNLDTATYDMFEAGPDVYKRLAFSKQNIDDANACYTFQELQNKFNNRANREESYHNCMKMSGVETPVVDFGLIKASSKTGTYHFTSTRNNNISNRGQKGTLEIVAVGTKSLNGRDITFGDDVSLAMILGGVGAVVLVVGGFIAMKKRNNGSAQTMPQGNHVSASYNPQYNQQYNQQQQQGYYQ